MMKKKTWSILMLVLMLAGGFWLGRLTVDRSTAPDEAAEQQEADEVWTCSMHPQIRQPEPGACPICAMDLIPVSADGGEDDGPGVRLTLSEHARRLAEVETAPVERRRVTLPLNLSGKIAVDESRRRTIAARMPGRLDRLYVDFTGMTVKRGDHLAEIYSPELLAAQEELIQARSFLASQRRQGAEAARAEQTLEAAREKLLLLGLSETQVSDIERRGEPSDHVTLYAPTGGIVLKRLADEGSYVQAGSVIYEMADLSTVWLNLDAYERDLPFLRYGQSVSFRVESYPGRMFEGMVSFIDPLVDDRTRTVRVRVQVNNEQGLLKPGMLVRASVSVTPNHRGRAVQPDFSGQWICPMHPEVIEAKAGSCRVCEMPLERAEKLGAVSTNDYRPPVVIPVSAALLTGERAIVYVEKEPGTYEAQTVELGPRAGDFYVVLSGLREGQQVVRRGAFKIDSEIQIRGQPSMMNPGGGSSAAAGHGQHKMTPGTAAEKSPQTQCPVMGGEINPDVFIDYKGYRIYFCCAGCDDTFLEDPEKYIEEMKAAGVELENAPAEPSTPDG